MTAKEKIKELFVSKLPFEITEEELRQLFSTCGTVRSIYMLNDDRGQFKGIAFIKMATEKENREALNMLDETLIQDHRIKVAPTRPKTPVADPEHEAEPAKEQRTRRRREPKGRKKIR